MFAEGWIAAVAAKVDEFAGVTEEVERAIQAYCKRNYPDVKISRMARRKINLADIAAIIAGEDQGNKVSLHKPMGRDEQQLLLV